MIRLLAKNIRFSPPKDRQVYLAVDLEGDFFISDDGDVLFHQPWFNVGELARGLQTWLQAGMPTRQPFEYESVDWDQVGVVRIEWRDDYWHVESVLDPALTGPGLTDDQITTAIRDYVKQVVESSPPDIRSRVLEYVMST